MPDLAEGLPSLATGLLRVTHAQASASSPVNPGEEDGTFLKADHKKGSEENVGSRQT